MFDQATGYTDMGLKRHPSLQDLSRDHHYVLLHARELRWASRGHGDLKKACSDFLEFWRSECSLHFEREEKGLFQYCEQCPGWSKSREVDLVFEQHRMIRASVDKLRACLEADGELSNIAAEIDALLDAHVRHEERIVFEKIQLELTEEELKLLKEHI